MDNIETVNLINKNFSQIIRHILLGFLVVAGLATSHPKLFTGMDVSNGWHLLLLATSAIVAGNTWYVFHRYGLHQFIDWAMCNLGCVGPAPSKRNAFLFGPYSKDIANHIKNHFPKKQKMKGLEIMSFCVRQVCT